MWASEGKLLHAEGITSAKALGQEQQGGQHGWSQAKEGKKKGDESKEAEPGSLGSPVWAIRRLLAFDFEDTGELLEGLADNGAYFESQCLGVAIATLFFESSPGMNPGPTNSRFMLTLVPQRNISALRVETWAWALGRAEGGKPEAQGAASWGSRKLCEGGAPTGEFALQGTSNVALALRRPAVNCPIAWGKEKGEMNPGLGWAGLQAPGLLNRLSRRLDPPHAPSMPPGSRPASGSQD